MDKFLSLNATQITILIAIIGLIQQYRKAHRENIDRLMKTENRLQSIEFNVKVMKDWFDINITSGLFYRDKK